MDEDSKKIIIYLQGVEQTLLLPLLSRAELSKLPNSPFYDRKALELVSKINYNFCNIAEKLGTLLNLCLMARAYQFDKLIKTYLQRHPKAVIVNLGAGLETTFYRVDNGKLTWVNIDLPEVISLRQQLLEPVERVYDLAESVLKDDWQKKVKSLGEKFFFFAGGLFMYFSPEEVQAFFKKLAKDFPNSELTFDVISERNLHHANIFLKKINMENAEMKWGFNRSINFETWSKHIKLVEKIKFFQDLQFHSSFSLSSQFKMIFYSLFFGPNIMHLKFQA